MGVYRAILPTEKMDYAKPNSSISQLEERPDRLDKAQWGIVRKTPMFMSRATYQDSRTEHLHVCQVFKRLEHPPLYVFNFYPFYASRK